MVYPSANDRPSQNAESKDERAERLAAALRENLKRRKAQARAQGAAQGGGKEVRLSGPARSSRSLRTPLGQDKEWPSFPTAGSAAWRRRRA